MSTDLVALKRLIKLPAEVARGEWQTGKLAQQGGDWWVAAILEVGAEQMSRFLPGPALETALDTPPGMSFGGSFAALKALPGAQRIKPDRLRLLVEVHGVEHYANSPLLGGNAIRLSSTQVFVVLWTS